MSDSDKAYIARCLDGCGAIIFAAVQSPMANRENAKEVSKLIRDGYTVETLTVAEARPLIGPCKNEVRPR